MKLGFLVFPALLAGAAIWYGTVSHPQELAAPRRYDEPKHLCTITDPAINESSGLAASRREPDIYYTHNDSGDQPRFFKFDSQGNLRGTYRIERATARDWEDMAAARLDGKSYLYFGDIGDNQAIRPNVVVYRAEEPSSTEAKVDRVETYELIYPDGAHDCEALMVHPMSGDLWLVTKMRKGLAGVYALKRPERSGRYTLTKLGELDIPSQFTAGRLITGGDISQDGQWVVLRTYFAAYEFPAQKPFADWFRRPWNRVTIAAEAQGEAIAYSADGRRLITTSEGTPFKVSSVERLGR